MKLSQALRIDYTTTKSPVISFVGSGGKTTAIFQLAHDLLSTSNPSIYITATTHLGEWQIKLADHHIIATDNINLNNLPSQGIILFTGEIEDDRTTPIGSKALNWLRETSQAKRIPLLIEADGSRQKPLKAPASHEPPIPDFSDIVAVVSGLSGLAELHSEEFVHQPKIFSQMSDLKLGQQITADALIRVLTHPQGGLKNIPSRARRIVLLNQADSSELQSIGGNMAPALLNNYDAVLVGSAQNNSFQTFENCAGIILAAGESTRFGSPKQLLDWKGKSFVWQVANTALQAGLWPVVVVTGFHATDVESALSGLPINIVHNPNYQLGQSTSIRAGVTSLPQHVGAAIFLLADQPQIPAEVIRALTESHSQKLQPILAPLVLEERRANPVLFDRVTFPDLLNLTGDVGGRAIFDKHHVKYLPWHDDILLFDVDNPEDYQRMKDLE